MSPSPSDFQFLRPLWLLLLLALPALWWIQRRRRVQAGTWQRAVDAHLLPHLLQQVDVKGGGGATLLGLIGGLLGILALAGPSWRQLPTPLWQLDAPLVIALDLSSAMRATDLPPSRLTQARAKLGHLLQQRQAGQVGLLAYAGDAFTVAPLTRDARTVGALLDSLAPDLMPVDGQRGDRAIERALTMLRDSGATGGDILLVTDHADTETVAAAQRAQQAGFRVSALGVGTVGGAPMTGADGFITSADGKPQLARLDPSSLVALASAGGGRQAVLGIDDSDLRALGVLDPAAAAPDGSRATSDTATHRPGDGVSRSDDGYWLLLGLLPLALLGFRRGWLALAPLVLALTLIAPERPAIAAAPAEPASAPPTAADTAAVTPVAATTGFSWDSLWRRADQRAFAALQQGDIENARQLAPDPALKGTAAYRGDDYAGAAAAWAGDDRADAHYNRGNALAKAGKLEEALKAYDEALAREPGMPDALANRKAVEDYLKQQQSKQDQKNPDQKNQDQKNQDQKNQDQQGQDQKGQDQKGQDQQGQDQKNQDQKNQDQQGQDQKNQDQKNQDQKNQDQQGQDQQGQDQKAQDQQGKDPQGEDQQSQDPSQQSDAGKKEDADPSKDEAKPAPSAADAERERAAEEAAKQQMQQALDAAGQEPEAPTESTPKVPMSAEERAESEQRQATEQWLRRVPDDPGGLLRRKFQMEYRRRLAEGDRQ